MKHQRITCKTADCNRFLAELTEADEVYVKCPCCKGMVRVYPLAESHPIGDNKHG